MNKNFLEHYMKTKPETTEQKYLFLVDNTELAFAIICAGFPATVEQQNRERNVHHISSRSNDQSL